MKTCWVAVALAVTMMVVPVRARACGCFTLPSPATPVVQAGERILFAHEGNNVVAYIQISYKGSADRFGWLVPLPTVPTLELGTDELFTTLGNATQAEYRLTTDRHLCGGGERVSTSSNSGIGCGAGEDTAAYAPVAADLGIAAFDMARSSEVVVQSSIGPYDYAVLKADSQMEMLKWLQDNRYFVPDGTSDAVQPYIHPGAYFLAIKLRAGESAGDIVPVIVRYTSDLPMIPITLTQVGAVPNMGVLVWVLGEARAIPRNYSHTVLNDLPVWTGTPYVDAAARAVKEVPGHHSFLTEYAGASAVMSGRLYSPGRFGDLTFLAQIRDPGDYIRYLASHRFTFDSTLYALLARYLPEPASLVQQGVSAGQFYGNYDFYASAGVGFGDAGPAQFDPVALTGDLETRIVKPTQATQALFDAHPYLTRLYTAISPADMNLDPVFSENPDLPGVSLVHQATVTIPCSGQPWLRTEGGLEVQYSFGLPPLLTGLPASLRIERLREAGDPELVVDNTASIRTQLGPVDHGSDKPASNRAPSSSGGSCDVQSKSRNRAGTALLVSLAVLWARRRRSVA